MFYEPGRSLAKITIRLMVFIITAASLQAAEVSLGAPPDKHPDAFGNVIPDFSMAGYRNGGIALPTAPVMETLNPAGANTDDAARIQAAIDRVAKLPKAGRDELRGAVLLTKGNYRCNTALRVPAGVTLRGQGQDANGTVITATMIPAAGSEPTLIHIEGQGSLTAAGKPHAILDEAVPLGRRDLKVAEAADFKPGDLVLVDRAASEAWIRDLKMDQIKLSAGGKQWKASEYRVQWTGRILKVQGDTLTLDTPVLCALERRYGGGTVRPATDTREGGAAVENLRLISVYNPGQENSDERHAWNAISLGRLVDSWVRNVTALHFAYACVNVSKTAARITVQDCAMLDPVSQITGGRRYSFVGGGSQVLIQRCYARNGRHDFVTGHLEVGPTVFLDCLAEQTHADIGPHHRWACGQLYDNVRGGQITIQDRGGMGTGHGWAGNCQVLWNCAGTSILCQKPWIASAQNWAIGCLGNPGKAALAGRPEGNWASRGQPVAPRSLYLSQLAARFESAGGKGAEAIRAVTTAEQQQGTLWENLHQRFAGDK